MSSHSGYKRPADRTADIRDHTELTTNTQGERVCKGMEKTMKHSEG